MILAHKIRTWKIFGQHYIILPHCNFCFLLFICSCRVGEIIFPQKADRIICENLIYDCHFGFNFCHKKNSHIFLVVERWVQKLCYNKVWTNKFSNSYPETYFSDLSTFLSFFQNQFQDLLVRSRIWHTYSQVPIIRTV